MKGASTPILEPLTRVYICCGHTDKKPLLRRHWVLTSNVCAFAQSITTHTHMRTHSTATNFPSLSYWQ